MKTQTTLLFVLFFCHFLADYTHLSTSKMLRAKRLGKPLFPILSHAAVHGVLMGLSLLLFSVKDPILYKLILLQVTSHFLIDVWKGRMNGWFPRLQAITNKWHWIVFGFDQFLHASIIILMVAYSGVE